MIKLFIINTLENYSFAPLKILLSIWKTFNNLVIN